MVRISAISILLAMFAKHKRFSNSLFTVLTLTAFAIASACASDNGLKPFSSDGCSLFPDRSLIGTADWCTCCLNHDLAYWKGGTSKERLDADQKLKTCIRETTGNAALADLMYAGVRGGGGPYFFTPYRWGYGWPYERPYAPLSDDEQEVAAKLERKYLISNPALSCPK